MFDAAKVQTYLEANADSINANRDFVYTSVEELLENLEHLEAMIVEFMEIQVPRLHVLESYASGRNFGIVTKDDRKEIDKADHRAKHDFGGDIVDFFVGYTMGVPVKVEHETLTTDSENEKDEEGNDPVKGLVDAINEYNDMNEINIECAKDCGIYGRAFEVVYRDLENMQDTEMEMDSVARSSVYETFVIRDTTIRGKQIAAVRLPIFQIGDEELIYISLYTDTEIIHFEPVEPGAIELKEMEREQHAYGMVPVTEWRNNRDRIGDFEKAISLIDLYDNSQSDTANYMTDLNDALLVIEGDSKVSEMDEEDIEVYAAMKQANMLLLESGEDMHGKQTTLKAYYLYKQYDVAGKEAYNKRIKEDIYRFCHCPDTSDEKFSGNTSGIAMQYKLLGTDQVWGRKVIQYTKAIRRRYTLIDAIMQVQNANVTIDSSNLEIIFTPNTPEDVWAETKTAIECGAEVSQKTLLSNLSYIRSAETEMRQLELEQGYGVEPEGPDTQVNVPSHMEL